MPSSQKRFRHLPTDRSVQSRRRAISALERSSAASNTIFARTTSRWARVYCPARDRSSRSSTSLSSMRYLLATATKIRHRRYDSYNPPRPYFRGRPLVRCLPAAGSAPCRAFCGGSPAPSLISKTPGTPPTTTISPSFQRPQRDVTSRALRALCRCWPPIRQTPRWVGFSRCWPSAAAACHGRWLARGVCDRASGQARSLLRGAAHSGVLLRRCAWLWGTSTSAQRRQSQRSPRRGPCGCRRQAD